MKEVDYGVEEFRYARWYEQSTRELNEKINEPPVLGLTGTMGPQGPVGTPLKSSNYNIITGTLNFHSVGETRVVVYGCNSTSMTVSADVYSKWLETFWQFENPDVLPLNRDES